MRFTRYIVILSLCLFMGSCYDPDVGVKIDIGDYEQWLNAWNRQNMTDYTLSLKYDTITGRGNKQAVITVKNGIPASSDPPEWLTSGEKSTIPDFFSFIKEEVEKLWENGEARTNRLKNGFFEVSYNKLYRYPDTIYYAHRTNGSSRGVEWAWEITLTPVIKNIDIGDYESHFAAWNSQNLLDYRLYLSYTDSTDNSEKYALVNVKNGVPESSDPPRWLASGEKSTIPEFFSFIKEEEERIKNVHASNSLIVCYESFDHYPTNISTDDYAWGLGVYLFEIGDE